MVDSGDIAVAGAALGGAYLLSARARGDDGKSRRPGRIPIPIGGAAGGNSGLSPGVAGLLASGGLGGGRSSQIGGLFEGVSGLLAGQQQQFGKILDAQQAGIASLIEAQSGVPQEFQDRLAAIEAKLDSVGRKETNRGGGGGSGDDPPPAPQSSGLPPEARGANPFLEAARGTGEAIDATAEFIGGPGDSASSGSIFGGIRKAGELTGDIPSNVGDAFGLGGRSGGSGSGGGGGFDPSPGSVAAAPFSGGLSVLGEETTEELLG